MRHSIREKWIDRLRSQGDRQATRRLGWVRNGEVYNCGLGVLCELAVEEGVIQRHVGPRESRNRPVTYGVPGDLTAADLPQAVMKWAGLDRTLPWVTYENSCTRRIDEMNDDGFPLDKIAKAIDEDADRRLDIED